MATRMKTFNAYQIDLHYIVKRLGVEYDSILWDPQIMEEILTHIYSLPLADKTKKIQDWLTYLDYLDSDEQFIFGRFLSAEYGTVGELIHSVTLTTRPNPKHIQEGEVQYTYFLIRKLDGFLLIQGDRRLTRSKVVEYIKEFGEQIMKKHNLTFIEISPLMANSFFDELNKLDKVDKIWVEISEKEVKADENLVVQSLRDDAVEINAKKIRLEFSAYYDRNGLLWTTRFFNKYKGSPGVTNIVIRGKVGRAERFLNLESSQEKYKQRIEVDKNNQLIMRSVEEVLKNIASQREFVLRKQSEIEVAATYKEREDDEKN